MKLYIGIKLFIFDDKLCDQKRCGNNIDPYGLFFKVSNSCKVIRNTLKSFEYNTQLPVQIFPASAESNASSSAFKQLYTKLVFKSLYRLCKCGLRNMKLFGSLGYLTAFSGYIKIFKLC